jgi:hypothetical protein
VRVEDTDRSPLLERDPVAECACDTLNDDDVVKKKVRVFDFDAVKDGVIPVAVIACDLDAVLSLERDADRLFDIE